VDRAVRRVKPPTQKVSRSQQAAATRQRVIKAAYHLFTTRGYAATTMTAIAEAAGVAVQTVYFAFHTKATLLSRSYDFAVMGEDRPRVPDRQPWYGAMVGATDVTAALRHLVAGVGEMMRRVTPLYVAARAGAEGDAETARVMTFHETWRARGYQEMVDLLQKKAPLRTGLTPERATQLLLLYVGMDVFHVLVDGYGWTIDDWTDWTVATLAEQIFGRVDRSRAG
jgi:AcrR family transcriptional regulator